MRVLVTGATGFVGRCLTSVFAASDLRVALRSGTFNTPSVDAVVVGEINEQTDWRAALADIDCVIHLAARVHIMKPTADDKDRFQQTNLLGTTQLATAAAAAGVKRFIFLSSIKVNGEARDRPYKASDIPRPVDDYGLSKLAAEQRLFEISSESGMNVIAIRPPLVYGPDVRANFLKLMSSVHRGIPLPLGSIRNVRSLVSVWNLCDLIRHVACASGLQSGVLMVSDGEDLSTPDLVRRLAVAMNRPARLIAVPVSLFELMGKVTGRSAQVSRLVGSLTTDISETRRILDWSPPLSVNEGIARTAQWYLQAHGARSA